MNNELWVIRDADGNIVFECDTQAEADRERQYYGEEYEVGTASVDEVFEFTFGMTATNYFKEVARGF